MFEKATRTAKYLKIGFAGPSGSGKTYTMLTVARELIPLLTTRGNERIALIDTEGGSAAMYAGDFDFDMVTLRTFHPDKYVEAIDIAVGNDYPIIIIDTLSQLWAGKEGLLEKKDQATRDASGNEFAGWRFITPIYNDFIHYMLGVPAHLMIGLRTKAEYNMEVNSRGRLAPVKVGLAPIMRPGFSFELDFLARMDNGTLSVEKTRIRQLPMDYTEFYPGKDMANRIAEWQLEAPVTEEIFYNTLSWTTFQKLAESRLSVDADMLRSFMSKNYGPDWPNSQKDTKYDVWKTIVSEEIWHT